MGWGGDLEVRRGFLGSSIGGQGRYGFANWKRESESVNGDHLLFRAGRVNQKGGYCPSGSSLLDRYVDFCYGLFSIF